MPLSPKHQWQIAYNAVRMESDPAKVFPLLWCAVMALERRSASWDNEPGTKAEVSARAGIHFDAPRAIGVVSGLRQGQLRKRA
jgi:hypothetical protein